MGLKPLRFISFDEKDGFDMVLMVKLSIQHCLNMDCLIRFKISQEKTGAL